MRIFFGLAALLVPMCAAPASADCAGDIRASIDLLATSGPYQMVSESVTNGIASARITQVVPPGKMQSFSISNGETLQFTIIDDKGWGTFRGVTSPLPVEMLETVSSALHTGTDLNAAELANASCETGGPYWKYSFKTMQGGVALSAALMVDSASGQPTQMTINMEVGGIQSQTRVLYSFDEAIAIEAPSAP